MGSSEIGGALRDLKASDTGGPVGAIEIPRVPLRLGSSGCLCYPLGTPETGGSLGAPETSETLSLGGPLCIPETGGPISASDVLWLPQRLGVP